MRKTAFLLIVLSLLMLPACKLDDDQSTTPTPPVDPAMQTLRDLGVTPERMVQLAQDDLRRQQQPAPQPEVAPAAPTPVAMPQTPVAVPAEQPAEAMQQASAASPPPSDQQGAYATPPAYDDSTSPPPAIQNVSDFYAPLMPYGSWINLPDYGYVWQPCVTLVNAAWRPYCQAGRWVYTDCGWYWQSDYSWGWAPFHYGRWVYLQRHRWVWTPDTLWSPAWVSWRRSNAYCGWAPLPPNAHFQLGVGLAFGHDTAFDLRLGLTSRSYTFVAGNHFGDHDLFSICVSIGQADAVYRATAYVPDTHVWNEHDRRIHDDGPGRDWMQHAFREPPRPIRVVDVHAPRPPQNIRLDRNDRHDAITPATVRPTPEPEHLPQVAPTAPAEEEREPTHTKHGMTKNVATPVEAVTTPAPEPRTTRHAVPDVVNENAAETHAHRASDVPKEVERAAPRTPTGMTPSDSQNMDSRSGDGRERHN